VEVLYEIPHQLILTFLTAIFSPSRFSDPEPEAIGAKNVLIIEEVVCHRTTLISGNETFGFSFPHDSFLTATLAMCLSDLRERHLRCIERAASERDASMKLF